MSNSSFSSKQTKKKSPDWKKEELQSNPMNLIRSDSVMGPHDLSPASISSVSLLLLPIYFSLLYFPSCRGEVISGRKFAGMHYQRQALPETSLDNAHLVSGHSAPVIIRDGIIERVPPSRPAPRWDKPTLRPYFDNVTQTRIVTAVEQTANLHCRVKHLGDRTVTWIRKKDVHVLTVGLFTYTTDDRFTAVHSEGSDNWTLRIASAQVPDSGTYECQVSIEPKISKSYTLHVVESRANIDGPKEIHMVSNSNINLTCRVTGSPDPPQYIYWYLGKTLINYSSRGGISVVTDKHSRTSRLVVTRATLPDSGNYTCAPANAQPASVNVYILNGEHPEAMQGGESTAIRCPSFRTLLWISFLSELRLIFFLHQR